MTGGLAVLNVVSVHNDHRLPGCACLCLVVFHALTLKLPVQTSLSVVPKLPVCVRSGKKGKLSAKQVHPES